MVPNLYIFPKDHKDVQEDGNPKTCPVCGASSTINQELSEWISELLESALKGMEQAEVISTEEMLSCIDDLNETWKEKQFNPEWDEIFVGSLDAEALYPSLDTDRVAKLCGETLVKSGLKIQNVDWKWATSYVALSFKKQWQVNRAGLADCIPRRRYKHGPRPQITSLEEQEGLEKWVRGKGMPDNLSKDQKDRILSW